MRTAILSFLLAILMVEIATSQQFQRTLDPGRISPGLDIDHRDNGDLGILSFVSGPNLFTGGYLNLTTLNVPNGIIGSYDLRLTGIAAADGKAVWWPSQKAWLVGMSALDPSQNKALFCIDEDLNLQWVKRFGESGDIQEENARRVAVAVSADDKAVLAGAAGNFALNDGRNDLFVAKINPDGSSVWEKQYRFSLDNSADAALGGLLALPDGSLLVSGTVNKSFSDNDNLFLLKTDASGNLLWAKEYGTPGNVLGAKEKGLDLCVLPNGHIVINGWVDEDLAFNQDGLLLETDENGNPLRSLSVDIQNGDFNLQINRVIALDNNQVVFSAGAWENTIPTDALELNMMASLSLDGTINWQHNYFDEILVGFGTPGDALLARAASGGYFMLANDALNFEYLRPVFIGTDDLGQSGCEKPVSLQIKTDRLFSAKNLNPVVVNVTTNQAAAASITVFTGYNFFLPQLELGPDTTFCAPAQIVLDATTPGADTYAWNTGAISPQLTVNTTGLYAVTVSAGAECFKLEDSVYVTVSNSLALNIIADTSGFCGTGLITLNAQSDPGTDLLWYNGLTTPTITVSDAGLYTISGQSSCGTATDTLELSLPECPGDCLFFVPNAFTPNDDGVNDRFGPFGGDCSNLRAFHFRLYNRWGALVFESREPTNRWNGEINNRPAASDVYVWQLEYRTERLGVVRKSGDVTLLR